MPVGIENLATGFLQGLNARKQQERQDVIDQREAERFDMQKAQFADNQAANQLSMKTNQFQLGQAQAKAEREKILQEKEDKFRKQWEGFARPFAMGNDQEGYNALERTYNDVGYMGKGAFKRDAQGNVLLDDKGNITFLTYGADGKPVSKSLNKDKMIEGFINSYDPLKHWEHEQKTAEEIAKENREQKNKIQLKGIEHGFNVALEKEKGKNQRALYGMKFNIDDPKKYLSKPSMDAFYDVQEVIDPYTKQKTFSKPVFNLQRFEEFRNYAHLKNIKPDENAFSLWLYEKKMAGQQPSGVTPPVNGLNATQPQKYDKSKTWALSQEITNQSQFKDVVVQLTKDGLSKDEIKQILKDKGIQVQ